LHKNTRQGKERKPPIQAASKSQPSMHMKSSLSCHHKPDRQGNPRIHLLSLALQQHRQLPLRSQETCTKVPHKPGNLAFVAELDSDEGAFPSFSIY
jgi:hypothetical protein